ncbi:MAG: L,D-transpeptidase family protein [Verrucomicrobiaceae bacterium]|nr:L,D-transpeptidase family protein [Verrucomicrobiaceae bacterium]
MKTQFIHGISFLVVSLASVSGAIPNPLPKAPEPVEDILRLQIFLDSQLFGPGKVDGRPGEFTTKALKRYQSAHGLPETDLASHTLDLSSVAETYSTYTIRQEDLKFVGDLPSRPSEQSKKKFLPYDSVLEFLTERFHCSPEFLVFINRPLKMSALKPGDEVKVPAVQPFVIEDLVEIASLPEIPEYQARVIKIDTREKLLGVWDGEKLLASLPITPGSGHLATPPGTYRILGISQLPTFRWDHSVLEYGVRSGDFYELPIGPNNPVGVMWIGLSRPGIGIHGTNSPQTIGRSASHGCMRTANWDVVRLAKQITKGMTVTIEGPKPDPRPVVAAAPKKTVPPPAPPPAPEPERKSWLRRLFGK